MEELDKLKAQIQHLQSRLEDEKRFHLEDCQYRDEIIKKLKANDGMAGAFVEIFKLQQETIRDLFHERNAVISDLITSIGSTIGATIAQSLPFDEKKEDSVT